MKKWREKSISEKAISQQYLQTILSKHLNEKEFCICYDEKKNGSLNVVFGSCKNEKGDGN